ncbi:MAG TPA: hypothetical protein VGD74_06535 [Vulgatibacter sp.]
MADTETILARLRASGDDAPLERLARLAVARDLETPLGALVDPSFFAGMFAGALRAWLASDEAEGWILDRVRELGDWLSARDATLGELVPPSLQRACVELAGRPYAPDREVTLFLLDRPPVRELLRHLLLEELLAFGRKLRAPVMENPLARGLGGLGRFARDRARAGAFASMASDVVGAVSDELERQLDRRAAEFADAALSRVLQRLGDLLCDPSRAEEQAELRQALLQGVFELDTSELARELDRSEPHVISAIVRRALSAWLERDETKGEIAEALGAVIAQDAGEPLRAVLARLGLLDEFMDLALAVARRQTRSLVESEPFAAWLGDLLGADEREPPPRKPGAKRKGS